MAKLNVRLIENVVNPSGKLPVSFPVKYSYIPSSGEFKGKEGPKTAEFIPVQYSEGIYVGYRYFDSFEVPTASEFGCGLSFTSFDFKNLNLFE